MFKLQGVAGTLFIPLEARVFASKRFPEFFYDGKTLSLVKYITDNGIQKKSSEYAFMASVARYHNTDAMTKVFIAKHGRCNIIYLGAGLETAYYRLKEPSAMFYEIDLPQVIAARQTVLGSCENEVLIGGDLFDLVWTERVDTTSPTLLIASGVFQYFTEQKVVQLLAQLQAVFCNAELIFDATNETGLRYANRYVQKTGNTDAKMYFFINDSSAFAQKTNTVLLEERPFFCDARRLLAKKLRLYTRIAMKVADDTQRTILVHLKLK